MKVHLTKQTANVINGLEMSVHGVGYIILYRESITAFMDDILHQASDTFLYGWGDLTVTEGVII